MFSGIWRLLNHFFVRCWPWYVCGLASVVLLPGDRVTSEMAYPRLIVEFLPAGLRGVMFAGFLVAFMSSVSSNMHSSGAVFVNDFYRPYLVQGASDRHYLWAIRAAMLVMTVLATWIALASNEILKLLQFAMTMSAAAGFVMLLRWFWWRVNGWADLSAQLLSLPVTLFFVRGPGQGWVQAATRWCGGESADDHYGVAFLFTVATTTGLWVLVMLATPPEPAEKLAAFFRRVRPYGCWGPVARACPDAIVTDDFWRDLRLYGLGLTLAMSLLFGMGLLLLGRPVFAWVLLAVGAGAGWRLVRAINRHHPPPAENAEAAELAAR
jgi:Na+/proline symporter